MNFFLGKSISWFAIVTLVCYVSESYETETMELRQTQSLPNLSLSNSNSQQTNKLKSKSNVESQYRGKLCSANYTFDYLQLALTWMPGYCTTSNCEIQVKPEFTIHGLWPSNRNLNNQISISKQQSDQISDCCFENYYRSSSMASIANELNKYWPSLSGRSDRFWADEWLKHGTCARNVPDLRGQVNYFQNTISLFKKLNIIDTLAEANIRPSYRPVQASAIIEALKSINNNKRVKLKCNYEPHQPVPILTEVCFCFNSQFVPISCSPSAAHCTRTVIMPDLKSPLSSSSPRTLSRSKSI